MLGGCCWLQLGLPNWVNYLVDLASTCCPTKKFEYGAVRVDIDDETYRGGTAAACSGRRGSELFL
jgi:hypothetical protein